MPTFEPFEMETGPDESLHLAVPIAGRDPIVITVEPVSAEWWLRFAALKQVIDDVGANRTPSGEDETAAAEVQPLGQVGLRTKLIGKENLDKLIEAGVASNVLQRVQTTAFVWHATGMDDDAALRVWLGKASTPTPIESTSETSTSDSTASANTTQRPASTKATTSRQRSKKP